MSLQGNLIAGPIPSCLLAAGMLCSEFAMQALIACRSQAILKVPCGVHSGPSTLQAVAALPFQLLLHSVLISSALLCSTVEMKLLAVRGSGLANLKYACRQQHASPIPDTEQFHLKCALSSLIKLATGGPFPGQQQSDG